MNPELAVVMDRIAKLHSMADPNNGATENEVAICNANIKKLLAKHNLSMAQVLQKKGAELKVEERGAEYVNFYSKWEQLMHTAVSGICGVALFYTVERKYSGDRVLSGNMTKVVFVGTATDIAIALKMREHLKRTIVSLSRKAARSAGADFSGNCYRLGVAYRLRQRAHEAVKMDTPAEQEQYGALVVVKNQEIDQHMKKLNLRQSAARGPQIQDHESFRKGVRDADAVDIGSKNRIE